VRHYADIQPCILQTSSITFFFSLHEKKERNGRFLSSSTFIASKAEPSSSCLVCVSVSPRHKPFFIRHLFDLSVQNDVFFLLDLLLLLFTALKRHYFRGSILVLTCSFRENAAQLSNTSLLDTSSANKANDDISRSFIKEEGSGTCSSLLRFFCFDGQKKRCLSSWAT
jgi:hypothetical protein